jgi:hypothetical protein
MVDVMNKACEHDGCTTHPNFDNPGDKGRGRFCAAHKLAGMVNMGAKRAAAVKDGTDALMLLAGDKRPKHME